MGITGHSDIRTLIKHYADTDKEAKKEAILERDRKFRETINI